MANIKVIYRLSDGGYSKEKPPYINNENCLANFIHSEDIEDDSEIDMHIICDSVSTETIGWLKKEYCTDDSCITHEVTKYGNGAESFNHALDLALSYDDKDLVYFVEDDYLHLPDWKIYLWDAIGMGADYVSLYDHPDKYMNPEDGGNPFVENGGEITRLFCGKSSHWKLTNSTTMTFASQVKTLKQDEHLIKKWTAGTHPNDFQMFLTLRDNGRALVTPVPARSTHGETWWLSPHVEWEKCVSKIQ